MIFFSCFQRSVKIIHDKNFNLTTLVLVNLAYAYAKIFVSKKILIILTANIHV